MSSSVVIISTVLALGATWFYLPMDRRRGQRGNIKFIMTTIVGLHTLLVLYNLALRRPPNLFARLGIPLNTPVDHIKSLLVKEARLTTFEERGAVIQIAPEIPNDVNTLLTRLGVHGSRDIYVRFGQRAMQTCLYCSSPADYTLLALSSVLLEYSRTATLLLFLTTHIYGRQRWRTNILGALTCAFLAEVYAFASASAVPLAKDVKTAFMWHDNLFLVRNALFLVLPVFIQLLPAVYPLPPTSVALASALGRLERTVPRAHLFKYFHQAVLRHPYTRERAVEFWANDAAKGNAARGNLDVQTTASKLGFGFTTPAGSRDGDGHESVLRANARMAVQSLKPLFIPPPS